VKLQSVFLRTYGLWIVLILIQLTIEYGTWCRIICIGCQFEMWPTWDSIWLSLRIACQKPLCTVLLMNSIIQHGKIVLAKIKYYSGMCGWKRKPFRALAVIFRLKCRLVMWINWIFLVYAVVTCNFCCWIYHYAILRQLCLFISSYVAYSLLQLQQMRHCISAVSRDVSSVQ